MNKILVLSESGSRLYGTFTENSDLDYYGVAINTPKDILLGRVSKNIQVDKGAINMIPDGADCSFWSLHFFVKLACEGQTTALDLVFSPPKFWLLSTPEWEDIYNNRKLLLSKQTEAFIRYARSQAAKYGTKGDRIESAEKVLEILKAHDPGLRLKDIWSLLPTDEHSKFLPPDTNNVDLYQVCGRKYGSTARVAYVIDQLEKFLKKYGTRAKLAKENKGADFKSLSHAYRVIGQMEEAVLTGDITFPRPDAKEILAIKTGQIPFIEVSAMLEAGLEKVESLLSSERCILPESVNKEFWEGLVVELSLKEVSSEVYQSN